MSFYVSGISSELAHYYRHGGVDANGQAPLRSISKGKSNPCRHCLSLIDEGDEKLVLSHRPFASLQPYSEIGPIFLHANACTRYQAPQLPAWFSYLTPALIRGYNSEDWIVYETGQIVEGQALAQTCEAILSRADVSYVHIRSRFNCFQCRVDRA